VQHAQGTHRLDGQRVQAHHLQLVACTPATGAPEVELPATVAQPGTPLVAEVLILGIDVPLVGPPKASADLQQGSSIQ